MTQDETHEMSAEMSAEMNAEMRTGKDIVKKTVIVGAVRYPELCQTGHRMLQEAGFEVRLNEATVPWDAETLARMVPGAAAAVCGVEVYDERMLDLASDLQIIARLGVGLDNIDCGAARARNIEVVNVPGGNSNAVAELALGLILSVLRRIPAMNADVREGRWDRYVGAELAGRTVALIGFGATAQRLARALRGMDVRVLAVDPNGDRLRAAELGTALVSRATALAEADIVSLHAPHTAETDRMVDSRFLGAMRRGAVLINTSRGALVDETALVDALRSGDLGGAGVDVYACEPPAPDNPLFQCENLVATSHAAADTTEAYEHIGVVTARAIIDYFHSRESPHRRTIRERERA